MRNIKDIKEILIKEIKMLDKTSSENLSNEIAKCNALSNASLTYIKAENLHIKVAELKIRGVEFEEK